MRTRRTQFSSPSKDENGEEFTNSVPTDQLNTSDDKENRRATYTKKGNKGKKHGKKGAVLCEDEEDGKSTFESCSTVPEEPQDEIESRRSTYTSKNNSAVINPITEENASEESTNRRGTFTKKRGRKPHKAAQELEINDPSNLNKHSVEQLESCAEENKKPRSSQSNGGKKKKVTKKSNSNGLSSPSNKDLLALIPEEMPESSVEPNNRRETFVKKDKKVEMEARKDDVNDPSPSSSKELLSSMPEETLEPCNEPESHRGTPAKQVGQQQRSTRSKDKKKKVDEKIIEAVPPPINEEFDNSIPVEMPKTSNDDGIRRETFVKQVPTMPVKPLKREATFDKAPKGSPMAPASQPHARINELTSEKPNIHKGSPLRKVAQESAASSPRTQLKALSARETKFSIGSSPAKKAVRTSLPKPHFSRSNKTPLRSSILSSTPSTLTHNSKLGVTTMPVKRTLASKPSKTPLKNLKLLPSKTPLKVNSTATPHTNKKLTKEATTPFSSVKRKLGTMPDFKKIHQQQVAKMENIVDYKKRTAARALNLLSPIATKPNRSMCMIPRPVNGMNTRISSASPAPFSRFGRPSDIKNPPTSTEKIREKERQILKGVRMNKRFLLQMEMRKLI